MSTLAAVEIALHVFPDLLPASYRERFAMHGVELYHRGILETTPIRGVPLPLMVRPHLGPPPADLKELGLAPADDDYDARCYSRISLPSDSLGLPNSTEMDRTDILMLGDSFGVAAGMAEPPGLCPRLAEVTGRVVFNLSVSAIGPVREEWLLDKVGFEKDPDCVVWLFYAGNDAMQSIEPLIHEHNGLNTWAEVYADRRPPFLFLPDLVREGLSSRPPAPAQAAPPGFRFRLADGSSQPIWFLPEYLRQLSWNRERWEASLGWRNTREIFKRVRKKCADRNVKLLVVYLPTKSQVYLPHVEADAQLLLSTAQLLWPETMEDGAEAFQSEVLENRNALEKSFMDFCAREGIAACSATPCIEELARAGILGFLATDTHWQEIGQEALLATLVDALVNLGVVDEDRRMQ